jgi:small GTP-binding protein
MKRTAFIAFVGRPNVGKSTLLNAILGEKVAIVSKKPQTTRNRITGIHTVGEDQMVFLDTPGVHKPRTKLGDFMVKTAKDTLSGVDLAVLVVEAREAVGDIEASLIENIKAADIPAILVVNKIDAVRPANIAKTIEAYAAANGLDDSSLSRNITYISIPYVGGAANEAQVNAVLAALRNAPTPQTVEGFSANGTVGSEQDLTPDNTGLAKMKDWLFASGRTVGDFDRVEIGSATYVLLYTGNGMRYGLVSARMRLYDAAFANWYNARVEQLTFGYNYDIIDGYDVK